MVPSSTLPPRSALISSSCASVTNCGAFMETPAPGNSTRRASELIASCRLAAFATRATRACGRPVHAPQRLCGLRWKDLRAGGEVSTHDTTVRTQTAQHAPSWCRGPGWPRGRTSAPAPPHCGTAHARRRAQQPQRAGPAGQTARRSAQPAAEAAKHLCGRHTRADVAAAARRTARARSCAPSRVASRRRFDAACHRSRKRACSQRVRRHDEGRNREGGGRASAVSGTRGAATWETRGV